MELSDRPRTLAVTQNVTVDGVIEMLDDWFDPQDEDEEMLALLHEHDEHCDAVLLGRQTFTDFRGFWRHRTDDPTGVSAYLDSVAKYVVSSTLTEPGWENSTILSGPLEEEIGRLKHAPGRDIVVTGSIDLTHGLLRAGLVDELRLFTYPVVQGRGRRLTPHGWSTGDLTLTESRRFTSGVTYATYRLGTSTDGAERESRSEAPR